MDTIQVGDIVTTKIGYEIVEVQVMRLPNAIVPGYVCKRVEGKGTVVRTAARLYKAPKA